MSTNYDNPNGYHALVEVTSTFSSNFYKKFGNEPFKSAGLSAFCYMEPFNIISFHPEFGERAFGTFDFDYKNGIWLLPVNPENMWLSEAKGIGDFYKIGIDSGYASVVAEIEPHIIRELEFDVTSIIRAREAIKLLEYSIRVTQDEIMPKKMAAFGKPVKK